MENTITANNEFDVQRFATRMGSVQKSFIREILKVTERPEVISFAGGLPNPISFPIEALSKAAQKVLAEDGANALQYSTTEGYQPLRRYISEHYFKTAGLHIDENDILITNGSQQGLDLLAKIFIDKGDNVLIERPGYLGAIQALSIFEPQFHSVALNSNGIDLKLLEQALRQYNPKMIYTVPNFQNPSGITYSADNRKAAAEIIRRYNAVFVEDNPYGELRFMGKNQPSFREFMPRAILLGTFSKTVSPAMRLGWICAPHDIMEKLIVAKQAADLHTNYFTQRVVYQYLHDNGIEDHINKIRDLYKRQCDCMTAAMERYFPEEVEFTRPEGGMFIWVTLPQGISALELMKAASDLNVAFVPGAPFYADGSYKDNTLRLNYTNSCEQDIEEGIRRLGNAIKAMRV